MAHPHTLLQALSASIIKKIRKNNKNNKTLIRQHKKIKKIKKQKKNYGAPAHSIAAVLCVSARIIKNYKKYKL